MREKRSVVGLTSVCVCSLLSRYNLSTLLTVANQDPNLNHRFQSADQKIVGLFHRPSFLLH